PQGRSHYRGGRRSGCHLEPGLYPTDPRSPAAHRRPTARDSHHRAVGPIYTVRLKPHTTSTGYNEDLPAQTCMIEIYDTTLRDGTQGEGITFSVADKIRIAERLDAFGVHYIEGGWPGSNPRDIEFFEEAKQRTFRRARLAEF